MDKLVKVWRKNGRPVSSLAPEVRGDLRSGRVARSGDRDTTANAFSRETGASASPKALVRVSRLNDTFGGLRHHLPLATNSTSPSSLKSVTIRTVRLSAPGLAAFRRTVRTCRSLLLGGVVVDLEDVVGSLESRDLERGRAADHQFPLGRLADLDLAQGDGRGVDRQRAARSPRSAARAPAGIAGCSS